MYVAMRRPLRPVRLGVSSANALAGLALAGASLVAQAGVISQELERRIAARGTHADTAVIVRFAQPLDVQALASTDRRARDNRLLLALKARSARNRAAIEPALAALGAERIKDLWIVNGIAATLPAVAVKQLAARQEIASIELDSFVQGGRSQRTPVGRARPFGEASAPAAPTRPTDLAPTRSTAASNISARPSTPGLGSGVTRRGL